MHCRSSSAAPLLQGAAACSLSANAQPPLSDFPSPRPSASVAAQHRAPAASVGHPAWSLDAVGDKHGLQPASQVPAFLYLNLEVSQPQH